jgi:hypothetical protein
MTELGRIGGFRKKRRDRPRVTPSVVNTAVLPVPPGPSQSAAVAPLAVPAAARQGEPKVADPAPSPAPAAPPVAAPTAPQN